MNKYNTFLHGLSNFMFNIILCIFAILWRPHESIYPSQHEIRGKYKLYSNISEI